MPQIPVTLFCEVGNVRCAEVRSWLMARGIDFVERRLTSAHEVGHGRAGTPLFGTPLLVIGDRAIYGYRLNAMAEAAEEFGLAKISR